MTGRSSIDTEAAQWVVRRDQNADSPEERREFEQWLAANAQHRRAYLALQDAWNQADALKAWIPHQGTINPRVLKDYAAPRPHRPWRRYAIAASLLGVLVGISLYAWYKPYLPATYVTQVGEFRRLMLADGSAVQLNTDSRIRVHLGAAQRKIVLLQGEAYFRVERDPSRPFIVLAANKTIRALGTAFTVRLREKDALEIIVTQGKVSMGDAHAIDEGPSVAKPDSSGGIPSPTTIDAGADATTQDADFGSKTVETRGPSTAAIVLSAHQRARTEAGNIQVEALTAPETARHLAWQFGELSFQGESLESVIAEFNRYNHRKLELADPALAELRIGGNFQATDLESFVAAMRRSFHVHAYRDTEVIRLSRR